MKLTKESVEKLQNDLNYLRDVVRPQVQEELAAARAMGDLSENADYDAARTKQSEIETKILQIEAQLRDVEIIDSVVDTSVVAINCLVTIYDEDDKEEYTYKIGDFVSSNPDENIISSDCALGKALIGHKAGETVQVKIEKPYNVVIRNIKAA